MMQEAARKRRVVTSSLCGEPVLTRWVFKEVIAEILKLYCNVNETRLLVEVVKAACRAIIWGRGGQYSTTTVLYLVLQLHSGRPYTIVNAYGMSTYHSLGNEGRVSM